MGGFIGIWVALYMCLKAFVGFLR